MSASGALVDDPSSRVDRLRELAPSLQAPDPTTRQTAVAAIESLIDECIAALANPEAEGAADDEAGLAMTWNVLASAVGSIADFVPIDVALTKLDAAADASRRVVGFSVDALGDVTLRRARLRGRLGHLEESLSLLRAELPRWSESQIYSPILHAELATLERATGDFRGALDSLAAAEAGLFDPSTELGKTYHATTRCEIAGERGQVYLDLGRADLAAPLFETERRLAEALTQPESQFASLLHRVHLHLARDDDRYALDLIDAAKKDTSHVLDDRECAALDVRAAQATARAAIDDASRLPDARQRTARALEWARRDDLLTSEDRVLAHLAAARVALLANEVEATTDLLATVHVLLAATGPKPSVVLEAQWCVLDAEVARRRAGSGGEAERSVTAARLRVAVETMLASWDAAPRLPSGLGFFQFASRCEPLVAAIRAEAALDPGTAGIQRGFDLVLAVDARSRLGAGIPATLSGLRSHVLLQDEALCVWVPSPGSTQLFVVTSTRIERFELAGITRLRKAGASLDDQLESGGDDRKAGHALFDLLFPEAARELVLGARHLTFSGLDWFGAPPIEAARLPDDTVLGVEKSVCRAPSLAWLESRARKGTAPPVQDLLLVAAPAFESGAAEPAFEPLSLADARADELLELYAKAELLSADGATIEALRDSLATTPAVLELFTHGFLDPSDSRPARLVLARSATGAGWKLTCDVAESLPAAEFVVLAACWSGVGPLRRGDAGAADLTGAFLFGGARVVASAGSDVRAGPAAALFSEMHARVRTGAAPSEALAVARRVLLETRDEWDLVERRRVAARFRLDGLGHRPLCFATSASTDDQGSSPVHPVAMALLVLVIAAAIGTLGWRWSRGSRSVDR